MHLRFSHSAMENLDLLIAESGTLHWALWYYIPFSEFFSIAIEILQCVLRTGEGGILHRRRGRKEGEDGGIVGRRKCLALCR